MSLTPRTRTIALSLSCLFAVAWICGCAGREVEPPGSQAAPSVVCPASGVLAEGENDPYFIAAGASVQYFAQNDGQSLELKTTEPTGLAIQANTYTAWDCLNDFYGLEEHSVSHLQIVDAWWVYLRLKGRYDMDRLRQVYAQLPGVVQVPPSVRMGDGPTTCASRSGDEYEYVIDDRRGDCPVGCTETTAYYFVSSAAGVVEQVDTWDGLPYDSSAPPWYALCEGY